MNEENKNYKWRWSLVGNAVSIHRYGNTNIFLYGIKQFKPGTKLYVNWLWGAGHEDVSVIGKARNGKVIEIVVQTKRIENFRLMKVYKPEILNKMKESKDIWWSDSEEDRQSIQGIADDLNSHSINNMLSETINIPISIVRNFDSVYLIRGYSYYLENRVNHLKRTNNLYTAEVIGNRKYKTAVKIDRNKQIVFTSCDCENGKINKRCKHIAATLIAAYYNGEYKE